MDRRNIAANTGSAEVRLQERMTQELHQRRMTSLKNLIKHPDFLVFWAWMQERTNLTSEVFHGNSRDVYDKGKRAVGLALLQDLLRLGEPGLKFRHAAEMQYLYDQQNILAALKDKEKNSK